MPWKADTNSSFVSGDVPTVAKTQPGPAGMTTYWDIQLLLCKCVGSCWKQHISHNKCKIPCWCTLCATGHIHCRGDLKQAPQVLVLHGEGQHTVNIYSTIVHTSVVLVVWRIHYLEDLRKGENTVSTNRGSSLWYCLDLWGIVPEFHGLCVRERISVPMESIRLHGLVPVGQLSREMHYHYLMK